MWTAKARGVCVDDHPAGERGSGLRTACLRDGGATRVWRARSACQWTRRTRAVRWHPWSRLLGCQAGPGTAYSASGRRMPPGAGPSASLGPRTRGSGLQPMCEACIHQATATLATGRSFARGAQAGRKAARQVQGRPLGAPAAQHQHQQQQRQHRLTQCNQPGMGALHDTRLLTKGARFTSLFPPPRGVVQRLVPGRLGLPPRGRRPHPKTGAPRR
jgi:hypothetical protein